jgi:GNAT superfamily N-acetyltransferase
LVEILQLQKECYQTEAETYNDYNIPPLTQDLESLKDEFKKSTILKGMVNGHIIASVRGYSDKETCYIERLIVNKDYQNRGLGRLLMNSIESIFKDCTRFELFTGFKSQKNLYLYNKLGYNEFKQQKINENLTFVYLEKKR